MSNPTITEFAKFIIELADDMKKSAESILQDNKHPTIGSGERLLKNVRIITTNTHYAGVAASRLREVLQYVLTPTYVYPEPHPIPPGFKRHIPMGGIAGGGGGVSLGGGAGGKPCVTTGPNGAGGGGGGFSGLTSVTVMTMGTPDSWSVPEPEASDKAPVTEFVEPEYGLTNWAMNDYK